MAELKRVRVWSGVLRAAHWAMAGAVLTALGSGGLMAWGREEAQALWIAAERVHRPAGYLLLGALVVRLVLLIAGPGSAGWRDLLPRGPQLAAAWSTLRFYLSGTRSPLPAYYGHNPLWGPVYLLLFLLLAAQCAAGLWLALPGLRGLVPMDYAAVVGRHGALAGAVFWITAAHLAAVALHDWRGRRWEISAMVHGDKVFEIQRPVPGPAVAGVQIRSVDADAIGHWEPPRE